MKKKQPKQEQIILRYEGDSESWKSMEPNYKAEYIVQKTRADLLEAQLNVLKDLIKELIK